MTTFPPALLPVCSGAASRRRTSWFLLNLIIGIGQEKRGSLINLEKANMLLVSLTGQIDDVKGRRTVQ